MEENARIVLQTEDMEELLGLAYGVTFSKFPALGILLYRGVFPLVPPDRAAASFEQLLIARDRLNLPPDDPSSDIMDKRLAEHEAEDGKDAEELRKSRRLLEVKAQEVRDLKDRWSGCKRRLCAVNSHAPCRCPSRLRSSPRRRTIRP